MTSIDPKIQDFGNTELNEFYKEAISLRRWDDEAKVANLVSPFLESFIASIESSLK